MVLQKRYTLPTFTLIGYLVASQNGNEQFHRFVDPFLSSGVRDFQYTYKESPLSEWHWPITICFSYLVSIFVLKAFMNGRKEFDLQYLRIFHNAFLCFGSFVMVLGMLVELYKSYMIGGLEALVCDSNQVQLHQTNLYNWYYVFFLSKFYEFIDTYILILKKKPVSFLHSFHHFITAYLCWLGLYDKAAIQWTIIALNGTVHVFMYYYYLAVSFKTEIWWKKYLTTMQITQFCLDVISTIPFFYSILVLGKKCSGSVQVIAFSDLILISFLILFINFFNKTYKKGEKAE